MTTESLRAPARDITGQVLQFLSTVAGLWKPILGFFGYLGLALAGIGKSVTCLSADGVPDIYSFLPGQHLLASPEADYVTGATYFVDGGLTWDYEEQ